MNDINELHYKTKIIIIYIYIYVYIYICTAILNSR